MSALRRTPVLVCVVALLGLATLLLAPGDRGSEPARETAAASGSTLLGVWSDPDGNGVLGRGPGEPLQPRTELAPEAKPTRTLATIDQLTDAHVRDEESPARAPILDRFAPELNSSFRPQEALSPQILDSAVRSINELAPDAVVQTGDLIDSDQLDELDQALGVLAGGTVDPNSGGPGYRGPQEPSNPDPFFYRPDLDAPRHPGLLEAAQVPFEATGLDAPWFPVTGNHDTLVQGEVPPTPRLDALAVGDRILTGLDPNFQLDTGQTPELTPALVNQVLANGLPGTTEPVPADPRRRHLAAGATIARMVDASGNGALDRGLLQYSFELGPGLTGIALDLVDRGGGSAGVVAPGTTEWLRAELDRLAPGERVIVFSHQSIGSSEGGAALQAVLDADPRVIATVAGHSHRNAIDPRPTAAGGYWQITTSSLADYPMQTRALRVSETADGGTAIETWMLDGAPSPLADTARQLGYLDAGGGRPQGNLGDQSDRNATLYLPPITK